MFRSIAGGSDLDFDLRLRRVLRRSRALSSAAGRPLRAGVEPAYDVQVDANIADNRRRDVRGGGDERIRKQVSFLLSKTGLQSFKIQVPGVRRGT